jgi:hypothetical protein
MGNCVSPLSNLPPGCSESDIPGNRPEDVRWEKWLEEALGALDELGLADCGGSAEEAILDHLSDLYANGDEMTPQRAADLVAEHLSELEIDKLERRNEP